MHPAYDTIGINYANLRKPDPRIETRIWAVLGTARTVVNIGAGAGGYEPTDRQVTAVEPSGEMISQRPASDATVIQGYAEDLPFEDNSFDAAMASLTVHHWSDQQRGINEMRRVSRGPVILFTHDPDFRSFWLTEYFPELNTLDDGQMPPLSDYERWLGDVEISAVPVPHDCTDGFLAGYWRRPAAYLDQRVRAAMSPFWLIDGVPEGLARLERDLKTGAWERKYGHLLDLEACDCGYRLVTAN